MVWNAKEDFSGAELQKIWPFIVPYTRGRVLDIGAGQIRLFSHWMTQDTGKDYGGRRVADFTGDGEKDLMVTDRSLDAIVSSHFLEHCVAWKGAIGLWWSKIKLGGHLVLYWPHPDHYPKCGQPGANPDHKWDIYPEEVRALMAENAGGFDLLEDETRIEGNEYSQFMVYRKRADTVQVIQPWRRPEKSVLVIRYGAFGDALTAASILPELKKQGYHVTYNGQSDSAAVIAHDPHVDAWILQDKDQVPNENLGLYWAGLAKRYDKVINLNESVEATALALPGSSKDKWPTAMRQKYLGELNYLELTHDIAEVPHEFHQRFYATEAEKALAADQRKALIGTRPLIAWVLRGSSVHKIWPYVRAVVARLINKTDAAVMLLGGKDCVEFEQAILSYVAEVCGKDAVKRVWVTCGEFPIRASMVFATQSADVLVGPETGILNAGALDPLQKVIFLSHSSQENLTKHWVNTRVLEAFPPCRPCHQLHYGWERCKQDQKTTAALCQSMIDPDAAEAAITAALADALAAKQIVADINATAEKPPAHIEVEREEEPDPEIPDDPTLPQLTEARPPGRGNGAAHP